MSKGYVRRGDWYYYMRRVPKHASAYDKRTHVRIALKTKSEREAARMVAIYDDYMDRYWGDLIRSESADSKGKEFQRIRRLAKAYGFAYKNMAELIESPVHEILSRVEAVDLEQPDSAKALLGNAEIGRIHLRDCMEHFWPLCADRLVGKNDHQVRKFKNPRFAALQNFIKVVGNISLHEVERSHALKFRNWLLERIQKGQIVGNTANKQLTFIKDVLTTVGRDLEIPTDFKLLFAETKVKQTTATRPPFETEWVQNEFINKGRLKGMNEDARMLAFMMIETGAREAELIGLEHEDFFLDAKVPHIWIRKNQLRDLKTLSSDRKIPLVGIALLAAKKIFPEGFTRYHKHPESASAAANKYLKNHNLRPTPKHSLYSLRHTFKDRLRDAEAPEEVIHELMGHTKRGAQYGRGHTLEKKHEWLKKIAFDVPTTFKN